MGFRTDEPEKTQREVNVHVIWNRFMSESSYRCATTVKRRRARAPRSNKKACYSCPATLGSKPSCR